MFRRFWLLVAWALTDAASAQAQDYELRFVRSLPLYLPEIGLDEPSGLSVDDKGKGFWIVSDNTKAVFWLDAGGGLQRQYEDPRLHDLEGIALDAENKRLLLVSEETASLIEVGLQPPHPISRRPLSEMVSYIDLEEVLPDRRNGLEGITIDPLTGTVFVVSERDPKLLIEISSDLESVVGVHDLDRVPVPKESNHDDVSGIVMDTLRNGFWVVSDTGRSVDFLSRDLGDGKTFDLYWEIDGKRRRLHNPEGVGLSPDGRFLFVLSDDGRDSKLVQYQVGSVQ
ncbi:SdiA-regulated domain-containing protein [Marivita geojedonensis]|uniref:SdiA-regulated domain-containing protein n=1 Tax=Marivita geojedonensis TaxID=1123756 RepID=UPI000A1FCB15|nr:SdiA-regulated domain-containing protein [Marivita geojedonensis]